MVIFTEGAEKLAKRQTTSADELIEEINESLSAMPGESVVDGIVKHGDSFIVLYTFTTRARLGGPHYIEKRCACFRKRDCIYRMQFNMIVE
jgi:intein/homing endonuclease